MTAHLTADALRVARQLTGLSQREVEQLTGVARKSLVAAETAETAAKLRQTTLSRLRSFYEDQGIEFLGTIDVTTGTAKGLGARWRMPDQLPPSGGERPAVHSEPTGLAFSAARALLDVKQSEVSRLVSMPEHRIRVLEAGLEKNATAHTRLRAFYESNGVEFLGWGDVSRGVFYGVGVRWQLEVDSDRISCLRASSEGSRHGYP